MCSKFSPQAGHSLLLWSPSNEMKFCTHSEQEPAGRGRQQAGCVSRRAALAGRCGAQLRDTCCMEARTKTVMP